MYLDSVTIFVVWALFSPVHWIWNEVFNIRLKCRLSALIEAYLHYIHHLGGKIWINQSDIANKSKSMCQNQWFGTLFKSKTAPVSSAIANKLVDHGILRSRTNSEAFGAIRSAARQQSKIHCRSHRGVCLRAANLHVLHCQLTWIQPNVRFTFWRRDRRPKISQNKQKPKTAAAQAWHSLEDAQHLVMPMARRLLAVIKCKGFSTKYQMRQLYDYVHLYNCIKCPLKWTDVLKGLQFLHGSLDMDVNSLTLMPYSLPIFIVSFKTCWSTDPKRHKCVRILKGGIQ